MGFLSGFAPLFGLLGAVVAMVAKGLPVGAVPKELLIALVGLDVIDQFGRLATADANGIVSKEGFAFPLPLAGVAPLPGAWPFPVKSGLPGLAARGNETALFAA
ncbi:hypothetical protein AZF01_01175 [Martelella sp. AD-3]|nr:hypothetical protein AZF01_01175 [Martelella sp. AD-3]